MGRLPLQRVVKMPAEVQAADALRESIVAGLIPAGERLTETRISEQMSLSRATVRTALHQLASEGLLTLVPYTGWSVVSLSADDVWELYTVRSAIERLGGQLSARAIEPVGAARLQSALDLLVEACAARDAGRIADADFALHKTVIEQAGNRRLVAQYGLIEQQIRMYIRSSDALSPDADTIVQQHRSIVEAILAGDEAESGRRSEEHNLVEGAKLSAHLRGL